MQSWEKFKANTKSEWHEINYSAMVEDPGKTGADIAEFLGVDTEVMASLYEEHFVPRGHQEWKKEIPDINEKLSKEHLELLDAHGFGS